MIESDIMFLEVPFPCDLLNYNTLGVQQMWLQLNLFCKGCQRYRTPFRKVFGITFTSFTFADVI